MGFSIILNINFSCLIVLLDGIILYILKVSFIEIKWEKEMIKVDSF